MRILLQVLDLDALVRRLVEPPLIVAARRLMFRRPSLTVDSRVIVFFHTGLRLSSHVGSQFDYT